jgi:hypothetical protein
MALSSKEIQIARLKSLMQADPMNAAMYRSMLNEINFVKEEDIKPIKTLPNGADKKDTVKSLLDKSPEDILASIPDENKDEETKNKSPFTGPASTQLNEGQNNEPSKELLTKIKSFSVTVIVSLLQKKFTELNLDVSEIKKHKTPKNEVLVPFAAKYLTLEDFKDE